MTENEFLKYIDDLISWINARRSQPLILSDLGADTAIKALNEYKQYHAIGTVEECREARERQRGKKRVLDSYCGFNSYECPICGAEPVSDSNYCHKCGQRLE